MAHLLEDPRLPDGRTAYHDGIHAVGVEGATSLFARGDIAVADDGDVHAGIVLHRPDERPVSLPRVHLGTGTAMDGKRLDAAVLQCLRQLDDDPTIVVPAEARLDRHGDLHRLDDLTYDLQHQGGATKHPAASALTCHPLDGAAEVKVQEVRSRGLGDACRLHHRGNLAPVDLDGYGALLGVDG